jgi:putative protease
MRRLATAAAQPHGETVGDLAVTAPFWHWCVPGIAPTKEHHVAEVEVGTVNKYFDKIGVGMVQVTQGELAVGDTIHIKGKSTDLTATISSMQVQRQPVQTAKPGDEAGIKLDSKVRQNDKVFKVTA